MSNLYQKYFLRLLDQFSFAVSSDATTSDVVSSKFFYEDDAGIDDWQQESILERFVQENVVKKVCKIEPPDTFRKILRIHQHRSLHNGYKIEIRKKHLAEFKLKRFDAIEEMTDERIRLVLKNGIGLFVDTQPKNAYGVKGRRLEIIRKLFERGGKCDRKELVSDVEPKYLKREFGKMNALIIKELGLKEDVLLYPESGTLCEINPIYVTELLGFDRGAL